jgi:hypothetical protein
MYELVCCNIIVILIKLSAFIGLNCNNLFIMHGTKNMKLINTTIKFIVVIIKIRVSVVFSYFITMYITIK